jgi:nitrite reductase/ring-hydroxylating ferredoxin subunit
MARFPFPVPNGWFAVSWGRDLAPGDVRAVHYFGRELVLFRSEAGSAHVLDAHCPHLGAHLGRGGSVVGDTLQCPFHAWRWAGDGHCAAIPYARRIPPTARIHSWPVVERNGAILVWHHAEGKPPSFEVPTCSEFEDPGWTTPQLHSFEIATCAQEMAENSVDPAHFTAVHGVPSPPASRAVFEGPVKRTENRGMLETPRGPVETSISSETRGFGCGFTRTRGIAEMCFFSSVSPIDAEHIRVFWAFTAQRKGDSDEPTGGAAAFIKEFLRQVEQDIPIWESKVYTPRPLLCDGDGQIAEFRRWARQFYSGAGAEAEG